MFNRARVFIVKLIRWPRYCQAHRDQAGAQACPVCEGYTQGYAAGTRDERRLAKRQAARKPRPGMPLPKKVMGSRRYDQVNRDRARPRKAPHSV